MTAFDGIPLAYRCGALAPVSEECTAWDLPVTGSIPASLDGLYLRNGPNPAPVPYQGPYHWFMPDGMLHGVRICNGKALWYRNRWVRTDALAAKLDLARPMGGPPDVALLPNTSNTSVIAHAGRVLTLAEWGLPHEVTDELDTIGRYDFAGQLSAPMTAHPKIDPRTGEMYFTSFGPLEPYLRYFVVSADGVLTRSEVIDVKGGSLMHDWAITEHHVLFFDLSVIFDAEYGARAGFPYRWDDDYGARIGIMPKTGTSSDVRWFDIDPCVIIHSLNAYEDGTAIVLEAPRYSDQVREKWSADVLAIDVGASLHRWRLDLVDGTVREQQLDERTFDFPKVNPTLLGTKCNTGYGVATTYGDGHTAFGSLLKWNLDSGACETHSVGAGRAASEGTFVADPTARGEDEGWVLSYVYDPASDTSNLIIVDATKFDGPPQAVISLPRRVPLGFHGCWIPTCEEGTP
jgi:carotenoid cleavage dioxygenase-like enzyme